MKGMNLKKFSKIAAVILVVFAMAFSFLLGDMANVMAAEKIADLDTSTKYTESLGDNASTEYAGRVWTDKSVFGKRDIKFSDSGVEVINDSDFLVSFSALATSQEVEGQTNAPLDVVFVIDLSASMDDTMKNANGQNAGSRLKNTIAALNTSITNLMSLNDTTRVAVVGYGSKAEVLLELGHYSKKNNTDWFTLNNDESKITVTTSEGVVKTLSKTSKSGYTGTYYLGGETNIQVGVYTGMNILASLSSTDKTNDKDIYANVNETTIKRTPSVVIMSDGAPTSSSDSTNWWNPENNDGNGNGSDFYSGNGLKAMMTATYMKEAINRTYGLTSGDTKTTVYTIGMGISELSTNNSGTQGYAPRYLAQITLNPKQYLDEDDNNVVDNVVTGKNPDNVHETAIKNALISYNNGQSPSVKVNSGNSGNYVVTHPTSNKITVAQVLNYVNIHYNANSSETVDSVFKEIVREISLGAAEVPTEVSGNGDALKSGHITYTDPIGDYMEVKALKGIVFRNVLYTAVNKSAPVIEGNVTKTTYTFTQNVETYIHGTQNLNNIIIKVTSELDANGVKKETMTIEVPAALIPLRINTIKLSSSGQVTLNESNDALPIRVLYTVGMQEDIIDTKGNVTTNVSMDYISNHLNDDGTVNFYSNVYEGKEMELTHSNGVKEPTTVGDATAVFVPADTNPFYYMQEDAVIYKTNNNGKLSDPVGYNESLQSNRTYYYYGVKYYYGYTIRTEIVERTGSQLDQVSLINVNGNKARPKGSARLNRILEFEGTKSYNNTETARDFYTPTYVGNAQTDRYGGSFKVYLGNNGVVSYNAPNRLVISKTVRVPEGFDLSKHTDKEFDIKVTLVNNTTTVDGNYSIAVDGTMLENPVTFNNGVAIIKLKHGQSATIYGLPDGTTYKVSEENVANTYDVECKYSDNNGKMLGNATTGAEVDTVDVTNTYTPTSVSYPTNDDIKVSKHLVGVDNPSNYDEKFQFVLSPYQNAPMPSGASDGQKVVTLDPDNWTTVNAKEKEYSASIGFGTITYDKPGTYYYSIVEKEPAADDFLPGITYSRAYYRLIVTVTDNGRGQLSASHQIQILLGQDGEIKYELDNGTPVINPNNGLYNSIEQDKDEAIFSNRFSNSSIVVNPVANKEYDDKSGSNPLANDMFEFKLTPVGYFTGNTLTETTNIPMGTTTGSDIVTNINEKVTFSGITYTTTDLGTDTSPKTYRYLIQEVDKHVGGMTYDSQEWYMDVTLSMQNNVLTTNVAYYKVDNLTNPITLPTFNNSYEVTPTTAEVKVAKTLTGREWQNGDSFEFKLTGYDEVTKNAIDNSNVVLGNNESAEKITTLTTTVNGTNKTSTFDAITFNKVGTYKFVIKETEGDISGLTYDSSEKIVTIDVKDQNGQLVAVVDYDGNLETTNDAVPMFTNTYNTIPTVTPINLNGKKVLDGRPLRVNDFTFVIEPGAVILEGKNAPENYKAPLGAGDGRSVNDANGNIVLLNNISYDKAGTYEYIISEYIPTEAEGHRPGITNDLSQYRVIVTVTDKDSSGLQVGQLTANITSIKKIVNNLGENIDEPVELLGANNSSGINDLIEFKNVYTPANGTYSHIGLEKLIEGDMVLKGGEFEFKLSLKTGNNDGIEFTGDSDNDDVVIVTNDANGDINFGVVTFTKEGTYVVTVEEVVPSDAVNNVLNGVTYNTTNNIIETTFKVTDDLNGNLVVTRESSTGSSDFINKYVGTGELVGTKDLVVNKVLTGRNWKNDDSFTFTLEASDTVTKEAIANGYVVLPTDASGIVINGNDSDKSANFGNITFSKAGRYEFAIKEDTTNPIDGINYDDVPRIAVVTVVESDDNADNNPDYKGKLVASVEYYLDNDKDLTIDENETVVSSLTFTNRYVPDEVVLYGHDSLVVQKNFEGRFEDEWLSTDIFKFTIAPDMSDETTKNAINNEYITLGRTELTITSENKQHAHFGDITFTKEGTYKFIVTEIDTGIEGVTYDLTQRTVIVDVTDNTDGELIAAIRRTSDPLVFRNTYDTEETVLDGDTFLKVKKTISGRDWFSNDEFKFILTIDIESQETLDAFNKGYILLPANANGINITGDDATKEANFGDIIFKEAGTYTFVIKEEKGSIANMAYDGHSVKITVSVVDNNEGELVATKLAPTSTGSFEFVNTFTPTHITATLEGTKLLDGRKLKDSEFSFKIEAANELAKTHLPASTTISNQANGRIEFAPITYTKEGTYKYTISEVNGTLPGVTYDERTATATVVVSYDSSTGELSRKISYDKVKENYVGFVFENTYTATPVTVKDVFDITKNVTGIYTINENDFKFRITPKSDTNPASDPVAELIAQGQKDYVVTNGVATGTTVSIDVFGTTGVTFTEPGTYVYEIAEISTELAGMTYDHSSYILTVEVVDENAVLKATTTLTKDDTAYTGNIQFNNTYNATEVKVNFEGRKTIAGTVLGENNKFKFHLVGNNGAPMPSTSTTENDATNNIVGTFRFGDITFTEEDYVKSTTYTYTITEIAEDSKGYTYSSAEYTAVVELTHDQTGAILVADVTYKDASGKPATDVVFENSYKPLPVELVVETGIGGKIITGIQDIDKAYFTGKFKFNILDKNNEVVATATNDKDGKLVFTPIQFTETGKYYFTAIEKNNGLNGIDYDLNTFVFEVVVSDVKGQLNAVVTSATKLTDDKYVIADIKFTNKYTARPTEVQFGINKVLEGRDLVNGEFTFVIKDEQGNVLRESTNDIDGVVVFKPITFDTAGTYKYTISEVPGEDSHIKYDDTKYPITIKVIDSLDGYLYTEIDDNDLEGLVFINDYTPDPIDVKVDLTKILNNNTDKVIDLNKFAYEITSENSVIADKVAFDANGKAVHTFTYSEEDIGKTYKYVVKEVNTEVDYVEYDETIYNLAITILQNSDGTLYAKILVNGKECDQIAIEFRNTFVFDPDLSIKKQQSVNGNTSDNQKVNAGDKVTYTITVTNTGVGTAEKVTVVDKIPEGLKLVAGSVSNGGSYNSLTREVKWVVDVTDSKEVVLSFEVIVPEVTVDTKWTNIATFTSDDSNDPDGPTIDIPSNEVTVETTGTPKTGDNNATALWATTMLLSFAGFVVLTRKREEF